MRIEEKKNNSQAFSPVEVEATLSLLKIGVAKLDEKFNLKYANAVFSKIAGYPIEELLSKNFFSLLKTGTHSHNTSDIFSQINRQSETPFLVSLQRQNDTIAICTIKSVHQLNDDGTVSFIVLIEEVNQKKAEEKILEQNFLRYNILSKAVHEGLWDWNIQTQQLYYNNNIKKIFGYDDDELKHGFGWWKNNIHKDDQEKVLTRLQMAMEEVTVESLHNEYRFLCKDGSYKVIADWFSIMRNNEGEPVRLIVSMQDYTEQQTLEKQLDDKEVAYRRQLARTVMDTQESERRKLAEELHDNVNQLLGVVKLYIEHSITNDNIREGLLKKSNEYIDKAIAELRNLSKNLAPPLLKELGLEHSVNSLADVISGVQDINITVDMMDFDEDGLTESHMLMLYRIIQEQFNNITKHSKAKNAGVTIRKTGSKVKLIIIDDGIGVDLTVDNAEGMGLRNIRNRIELYQGKVNMITSPGNGFILKVEFEI